MGDKKQETGYEALLNHYLEVFYLTAAQVAVFYVGLAIYHFCVFKRKLAREVAKALETQERLEHLSLLRTEQHTSAQKSLKSEITQESEKPKKPTKKAAKNGKKNEKEKKLKVEAKKKKPMKDIIEDTQEDSASELLGNPTQMTSLLSVQEDTPKTMILASKEMELSPTLKGTPGQEKTQITGPPAIIEEDLFNSTAYFNQPIKIVKPTTYTMDDENDNYNYIGGSREFINPKDGYPIPNSLQQHQYQTHNYQPNSQPILKYDPNPPLRHTKGTHNNISVNAPNNDNNPTNGGGHNLY
ncbi:unnamed protein product [Caenorhabditis angaria]|uniref:Uncharacterized protein n=1 Tax=Caenorhabditis angaria TaxID=860376 RepID=A0A9P1N1M7_9PELO|nr:unnamed protein product [Caenorhabditis angaria]